MTGLSSNEPIYPQGYCLGRVTHQLIQPVTSVSEEGGLLDRLLAILFVSRDASALNGTGILLNKELPHPLDVLKTDVGLLETAQPVFPIMVDYNLYTYQRPKRGKG